MLVHLQYALQCSASGVTTVLSLSWLQWMIERPKP